MSKAAIVEQAFGKLQIRAAKGKVRPKGFYTTEMIMAGTQG